MDNVAVSRTELLVDAVLATTDWSVFWAFTLDTAAYGDGPHTIAAEP